MRQGDDCALRCIQRLTGLALLGLAAGALPGEACAGEAPAAARPVHRFAEVRLSPDARWVAAVEGDAVTGGQRLDVRDLVLRSTDGQREFRVVLPCGRVPQCWPGSLAWSPDARRLDFTLRTPGSHAYGLYSVAPDGSDLRRLLDFPGTLTGLRFAPDGTLALLAVENANKEVGATQAGAPVAGDLDAPAPEQRIAVLAGTTLQWISPPDLFVYEFDWRPDGSGFVATAAPGDGDSNWWIAKILAFPRVPGAARVLHAPAGAGEQFASPRVSPDGRTLAYISGIMSDFGSTGGDVFALPLEGGPVRNLTPGMKASATALDWDCRGALVARLLAGDRTQTATIALSDAPEAPRVLRSGTESFGNDDELGSRACPSETVVDVHESFTAPPEIEIGSGGQWHDLTRVNAGITLAASVQSITWTNDGFDQQGWLLLPAHPKGRIPMVTEVHGGPAAAAVPAFAGSGEEQRVLAQGWALFYPNPRGSFGQGAAFTAANVRDFGYGDLRDILAGIDAVERAAPIDDDRLAIMGGSYGGYMTMWAVTQTHRFKAAVAAAGISNWLSYSGENGIDGWMLPYFGASVYDDPVTYARSSPINFMRNVRTPTFVWVGERDIECPAAQTQEFWRALRHFGIPTAIMIYPGEGHGLREPQNRADAADRTMRWLEQYLR